MIFTLVISLELQNLIGKIRIVQVKNEDLTLIVFNEVC